MGPTSRRGSIDWIGLAQVDVHAEEDEFQSLVTAGLSVLILGVETRLDMPLQQMVRMTWGTMDTVGQPRCSKHVHWLDCTQTIDSASGFHVPPLLPFHDSSSAILTNSRS